MIGIVERQQSARLIGVTSTPHMQDNMARRVLAYAGHDEPMIDLTPEEESGLIEAQAEMDFGEFATDAEVDFVFSRYRL